MTTTLIIPGLNSSGSAHWQTWFEHELADAVRVVQRDWKRADLADWSSRVRREITRSSHPVLIAAHSFGALAAAQAGEDHHDRIVGALLVAPADPARFGIEDLLPEKPLRFPVTIVASTNDPWLSLDRAKDLAGRWGAQLVVLRAAGHINAESGYGPWPFGLELLRQLQPVAPNRFHNRTENETLVHQSERVRAGWSADRADTARRSSFRPLLQTVGGVERHSPMHRSNNVIELSNEGEFLT